MNTPAFVPPIPADTSYAAKAVYSSDNFFLVVGERLPSLLEGVHPNGYQTARLLFRRERPALTMVTIFQFIERLSDLQAVEAVCSRTDWKYALHLSMNYSGMPASTLCDYRQWIMPDTSRQQKLQLILDRMSADGLLFEQQDQTILASTVLGEVCFVTRLDWIYRAMQMALEALAIHQPEWLRKVALPHWYDRYPRLPSRPNLPKTNEGRLSLVKSFGADAKYLLKAIREFPPQDIPMTEINDLEIVLNRQCNIHNGDLSWRADGCADCQGQTGEKEDGDR